MDFAMGKSVFIPLLAVVCMGLAFASYNSWEENNELQQDRLTCPLIKPEQIISSIERDLLNKPAEAFFHKSRITIGALHIFSESIQLEQGTHYSVPFTITGRMERKYLAFVRCSDLNDITYNKS